MTFEETIPALKAGRTIERDGEQFRMHDDGHIYTEGSNDDYYPCLTATDYEIVPELVYQYAYVYNKRWHMTSSRYATEEEVRDAIGLCGEMRRLDFTAKERDNDI